MNIVDEFGTRPHVPPTERWFEVLDRGAAAELASEYAAACETQWRNVVPQRAWTTRWKAMTRRAVARARPQPIRG